MFRVEFFCDDSKLGKVFWLLTGIALETPKATPVVNAKRTRSGIVQETNGRLIDMFEAHLAKHKPKQINAAYVREFLESNGSSAGSFSYVLGQMRDAKRIRKARGVKQGTGVKYDVLPPPKPKASAKSANGTGAQHGH